MLVPISFVSGRSGHVSVTPRAGHLIRPTSPKSPVASASAFESVEGSDDEDNMTDATKLDATYLHTNGGAVSKVTYIKHLLSISPLTVCLAGSGKHEKLFQFSRVFRTKFAFFLFISRAKHSELS